MSSTAPTSAASASRRAILAHERGPKLRIVKFKPKRGYKRRTGHRQELTRIEVTGIKLAKAAAPGAGGQDGEPAPADAPAATTETSEATDGA